MDLSTVTSLGERTAARLREIGVATVEDLASADAEKLADDLGVPVERARAFVREAQSLADAGAAAPEASWRVVLRDRAATATLRAGERLVDALPIVTARPGEDLAELRSEVDHDAVVLAQGESTAWVRLADGWHAGVPLFKERMGEEGATEIRVRVHEIRERAPSKNAEPPASRSADETTSVGADEEDDAPRPAKRGVFGKLFGKKS